MTRFFCTLLLALALTLAACAPRAVPTADPSATPPPTAAAFEPSGALLSVVGYRCDGGAEAEASYYGDGVALVYDGVAYGLPQVVAASGARYANETLEWWSRGDEAFAANPATGVVLERCQAVPDEAGRLEQPDVLNGSYRIDGETVVLLDGQSVAEDQVRTEVVAWAFGTPGSQAAGASPAQSAAVVLRQTSGEPESARYYLSVLETGISATGAGGPVEAAFLGAGLQLEEVAVDASGAITLRYLEDGEERFAAYLLEGGALVALADLGK